MATVDICARAVYPYCRPRRRDLYTDKGGGHGRLESAFRLR